MGNQCTLFGLFRVVITNFDQGFNDEFEGIHIVIIKDQSPLQADILVG
jgi:hypothetical protein